MSPAELLAAVRAARAYSITVGARSFRLQLPSPLDVSLAVAQADAEVGAGASLLAFRRLLERNLTGWDNVSLSDLLPQADAEPLAFDGQLVAALLDAQPDIERALRGDLVERLHARRDAGADLEKN